MKRAITVALACGVAAFVPATAVAGNGNGNGNGNHGKSAVAKQCAAAKKDDKAAFKALWGKHAMRDCIRSGGEDLEELENAAQQCRAEREADPVAFQETWGTNAPGGEKSKGAKRNAFGKCVSSTVREPEPEPEE